MSLLGSWRRVRFGHDRGFVGRVVSESFGLVLEGEQRQCPRCEGAGTIPTYRCALEEQTEPADPPLPLYVADMRAQLAKRDEAAG